MGCRDEVQTTTAHVKSVPNLHSSCPVCTLSYTSYARKVLDTAGHVQSVLDSTTHIQSAPHLYSKCQVRTQMSSAHVQLLPIFTVRFQRALLLCGSNVDRTPFLQHLYYPCLDSTPSSLPCTISTPSLLPTSSQHPISPFKIQ